MGHGPATEWGRDNAANYKSRLGIILFILYSAVYFGFVAINSISPKTMGMPVGSLNLAVVYGFGLIGLALVMAFAYNAMCSATEERLNRRAEQLAAWYDAMAKAGRLPKHWDKQHVLTFCETLISLEAEVTYDDGRNLPAIDAFVRLFEEGGKK